MATNDRNVVVLTHAVNATLSIYLSRYRHDGIIRSSTTACDYFGCKRAFELITQANISDIECKH